MRFGRRGGQSERRPVNRPRVGAITGRLPGVRARLRGGRSRLHLHVLRSDVFCGDSQRDEAIAANSSQLKTSLGIRHSLGEETPRRRSVQPAVFSGLSHATGSPPVGLTVGEGECSHPGSRYGTALLGEEPAGDGHIILRQPQGQVLPVRSVGKSGHRHGRRVRTVTGRRRGDLGESPAIGGSRSGDNSRLRTVERNRPSAALAATL